MYVHHTLFSTIQIFFNNTYRRSRVSPNQSTTLPRIGSPIHRFQIARLGVKRHLPRSITTIRRTIRSMDYHCIRMVLIRRESIDSSQSSISVMIGRLGTRCRNGALWQGGKGRGSRQGTVLESQSGPSHLEASFPVTTVPSFSLCPSAFFCADRQCCPKCPPKVRAT